MKTETVNMNKWNFEWTHSENGYKKGWHIITGEYDDVIDIPNGSEAEATAELITTAVNACKEINKDNPLKVALGLPQLFKRLDEVMNDKRLDWGLYGELAAIVDTLKSNF